MEEERKTITPEYMAGVIDSGAYFRFYKENGRWKYSVQLSRKWAYETMRQIQWQYGGAIRRRRNGGFEIRWGMGGVLELLNTIAKHLLDKSVYLEELERWEQKKEKGEATDEEANEIKEMFEYLNRGTKRKAIIKADKSMDW